MSKDTSNLEVLSSRKGFNSAVRHINTTVTISAEVGKNNLGDILYEMDDDNLSGERSGLLLRMLLIDKLGYKAVSQNLMSVAGDLPGLAAEFAKWKAVDLVAAYHHPDLGLLIANPKQADELKQFGTIRKNELLVIYAGVGAPFKDEKQAALCEKAANLAVQEFEGLKPKTPAELLKGSFGAKRLMKAEEDEAPKAPAKRGRKPAADKAVPAKRGRKPAAQASAPVKKASARVSAPKVTAAAPAITKGPVRMTPMYSVVVTNELFHNGNVEAWKKIIASYSAKYPGLQVYIYYDGERILDINSLFKWGKVKHGSAIQFAVAGAEIQGVAKLQRYLMQGASSGYEAFLHGPVGGVLKLFG